MLVYEAAADRSSPSSNVLDVGTKDGRFLADVPGDVVAIDVDLSPSVEGPTFLLADGCDLPFSDDSFDVAISNQVFEHVTPEQRVQMVDEIARVLRPGGEFLISAPNRYFPIGGSPHWMPPFWTFLPRWLGLRLARHVVDDRDLENYRTSLFPIAPWTLRRLLERRFGRVEYATLDLGERYGGDVWPDWFNAVFPYVERLASYPGLRTAFEWTFGYVSYRCTSPEPASGAPT